MGRRVLQWATHQVATRGRCYVVDSMGLASDVDAKETALRESGDSVWGRWEWKNIEDIFDIKIKFLSKFNLRH